MKLHSRLLNAWIALALLPLLVQANEVNVYSHRHYDSDKALFKTFEAQTGIKVNVVTAKAEELVSKLKLEGTNTPADLLITSDVGNLYEAKEGALLQATHSTILEANIPSHLRDSQNHWFALTKRARIFVYNPKKITQESLGSYLDLTQPSFKGKILTRTSTNSYNKALLSSIIAHHGEAKALLFAQGLVDNFARAPKGNDRDQIKAVASGEGDIAIVNTYYLGTMLNSQDPKDVEIAKSVSLFFPSQKSEGTHINISGAGITKYAKHPENAQKLIEFLSAKEAQTLFAQGNYEYPVNPNVQASGTVASWGSFKEDTLSLEEVGKHSKKAIEIATKANWR